MRRRAESRRQHLPAMILGAVSLPGECERPAGAKQEGSGHGPGRLRSREVFGAIRRFKVAESWFHGEVEA